MHLAGYGLTSLWFVSHAGTHDSSSQMRPRHDRTDCSGNQPLVMPPSTV